MPVQVDWTCELPEKLATQDRKTAILPIFPHIELGSHAINGSRRLLPSRANGIPLQVLEIDSSVRQKLRYDFPPRLTVVPHMPFAAQC